MIILFYFGEGTLVLSFETSDDPVAIKSRAWWFANIIG